MIIGQYPATRLRRNRQASWVRDLCSESDLTPSDLIWPVFVREAETSPTIASMPGVERLTIDELLEAAQQAADLGIPALALFPTTPTHLRSHDGAEALNPDNLICRAVRAIKSLNLNLGIITDVALDPYTDHGHDGIIIDGRVDNDATIQALEQQAYVQAQAGADALAPSDMMDGRIGAIREYLDDHGHQNKMIISYAVKYASGFYGPFRTAVGVSTLSGLKDKKTYQMNPANSREAMLECSLDEWEGADMLMVKPALPYLDILAKIREASDLPLAAYHVSGEYAMIMAAAQNGWVDADRVLMESMLSIKRAGANFILTYGAKRAAELSR